MTCPNTSAASDALIAALLSRSRRRANSSISAIGSLNRVTSMSRALNGSEKSRLPPANEMTLLSFSASICAAPIALVVRSSALPIASKSLSPAAAATSFSFSISWVVVPVALARSSRSSSERAALVASLPSATAAPVTAAVKTSPHRRVELPIADSEPPTRPT